MHIYFSEIPPKFPPPMYCGTILFLCFPFNTGSLESKSGPILAIQPRMPLNLNHSRSAYVVLETQPEEFVQAYYQLSYIHPLVETDFNHVVLNDLELPVQYIFPQTFGNCLVSVSPMQRLQVCISVPGQTYIVLNSNILLVFLCSISFSNHTSEQSILLRNTPRSIILRQNSNHAFFTMGMVSLFPSLGLNNLTSENNTTAGATR